MKKQDTDKSKKGMNREEFIKFLKKKQAKNNGEQNAKI